MENKYMPAFPTTTWDQLESGQIIQMTDGHGVSKLEFFACNAPVDIPSWFVHVPPTMEVTPEPNWRSLESKEDQDIIKCWLDAGCDIPEHLKWFAKQYAQYTEDDQAFRLANLSAKYFQWRRYYAEQLLAELSKPQP